jgi:hypothetical protein
VKLLIRVKPNSRKEKIEKIKDTELRVWVNQRAHDGLANSGLVELLSSYYGLPKSRINILKGRTSKTKVVEIIEY